jgi:hypothetical protein
MDFDQVLVGPPEMFHPLPPIGRPGLADGCVGTECSPACSPASVGPVQKNPALDPHRAHARAPAT